MATKGADTADAKAALEGTRIKWDDSGMKSSYANVCNVTSTREEVVLVFGMNRRGIAGRRKSRSNSPTESWLARTPPSG